jgi:hypothetical protein
MPQLLEMDRVVSYLDQQGFLKTHSPTATPGPGFSPGIQRQYDEVWFYARLRKTMAKPGSLPADLEREALELASESWPVSFMLAGYYAAGRDSPRTDELANRYAALVEVEPDEDRLAYYRGDIHGMTKQIGVMCEPQTAKRIRSILRNRFRPAAGWPASRLSTDVGVPV